MKTERNADLCKYCVECKKPCPYGFFNDDTCKLSEEQCKKREFVRDYLAPLLKATKFGIVDAIYTVENYEEIVTVKYKDSSVRVCVSADSLPALARDVLRVI